MRTFLRDFLSDPYVVDFPRALWLPILYGIVLRVRPPRSAELYRSIWTDTGSPLVVYTKRQCEMLKQALNGWDVRYAMTYTEPSIANQLNAFRESKINQITVLPLFPHWTPSSVGSILKQVQNWKNDQYTRKDRQSGTQIKVIRSWPEQPEFIKWYSNQILQRFDALSEAEKQKTAVVLSYHGVPMRAAHKPNQYRAECRQTSAAISQIMRENKVQVPVMTTFQSKFGPGAWLAPSTIKTLQQLPKAGTESVILAAPGFLSDCIETLDELDVLNRKTFEAAGGKLFLRISAINDDPAFVDIISSLIESK